MAESKRGRPPKNTDSEQKIPGRKGRRKTPVIPDEIDPNNLTEQVQTMWETGTLGIKAQINQAMSQADAVGAHPGKGKLSNFPAARMMRIEQDDEKRAFMAKAIANNFAFYKQGLFAPVKSDEELAERLDSFFQTCFETQQLPTVEKMGLAIGAAQRTMRDWETGKAPGFSPHTGKIITAAKQLLAAMDAELANEGKINAVTYIFRSKNFYGMRDTSDINVSTPNTLGEAVDKATIEAKYDELPE